LVTTSSPDGILDRIRLHCDGFFAFGSLPPAALPPFATRRTATGSLDGSGAALGCWVRGERRAHEPAELEQAVAAPGGGVPLASACARCGVTPADA